MGARIYITAMLHVYTGILLSVVVSLVPQGSVRPLTVLSYRNRLSNIQSFIELSKKNIERYYRNCRYGIQH